MIEIAGLTKLYGEFVAVNELSFCVQPGEVMGLVGPNGAGKTTTLRCLAGIIPPTRGAVRICGCDLAQDQIAAKKQLAFLNDEPRLFDYLTVWQHLNFVARIYGVTDFEPLGRTLLRTSEPPLPEVAACRALVRATGALLNQAAVLDRARARLTLLLAVGSVPAAVVGLFLQGFVEGLTDRPAVVAGFLLGTAAILIFGEAVYRRRAALDTRDMTQIGPVDAILVAFHGSDGENGSFQGLCEMFNLPYTGCDVLSSAIGMDKVTAKTLCRAHGIPVVEDVHFNESEWAADTASVYEKIEKLVYPVVVKPVRLGSSIGVAVASDRETLVLQFTGLEPLSGGFHYEGWAILGGQPFSTGKFNVNAAGQLLTLNGQVIANGAFETGRDLASAEAVVITIEPNGDTDALPSVTKFLAGTVSGNDATLTVADSRALGEFLLRQAVGGAKLPEPLK